MAATTSAGPWWQMLLPQPVSQNPPTSFRRPLNPAGRRENVFLGGHSALGPCLVRPALERSGGLLLLASTMLPASSNTFPTASTWWVLLHLAHHIIFPGIGIIEAIGKIKQLHSSNTSNWWVLLRLTNLQGFFNGVTL